MKIMDKSSGKIKIHSAKNSMGGIKEQTVSLSIIYGRLKEIFKQKAKQQVKYECGSFFFSQLDVELNPFV